MKIGIKKTVEVEAKVIQVHCKVRDEGSYTLKDQDGEEICSKEGYVPGFFPDKHFGDYLILDIEIESGKILNWVPPSKEQIQEFVEECSDDN